MYDKRKSHAKGAVAAVPAGFVLVAVWAVREFLGREIPAEVALAIMTGIAYCWAWGRNKTKHGWKR